MPRNQRAAQDSEAESIAKRYNQIAVSTDDFDESKKSGLVKRKHHPFVSFAKKISKSFVSLGKGAKYSEEMHDAVEFLEWDLKPEELDAFTKITLISCFIGAIIIGIICLFVLGDFLSGLFKDDVFLVQVLCFAPWIIVSFIVTYFVSIYPLTEAKKEQVRALTYMPDMLGYMVMSMKLVPNLEKAIEFAALHGKGKIADDLQKLIWNVQIGVHSSLAEALDSLAYRWGKFSSEFKQGLMRIRASVIENTEAKRYALLDKTMSEVLASVKAKMEEYARGLSQPSIMLFYLGVLLPLILIIILPVGSSFSGAPLSHPIILGFLYIILIPGGAYLFARNLIDKKPPSYEAPLIPDNYPGLPPKGTMIVGGMRMSIPFVLILLLVIGVAFSFFVSWQGLPPKSFISEDEFEFVDSFPLLPSGFPLILSPDQTAYDVQLKNGLIDEGDESNYFSSDPDNPGQLYYELKRQSLGIDEESLKQQLLIEEKVFYMKSGNSIAPSNLVFGLMLTFALLAFVYLYYSNIYKRKAQMQIEAMESEFKDSLYVLASRMGENKPVEDAIKHVKEFLPTYKISRIYDKTLENISVLSMPLEQAFFDKNYGSLKYVPSKMIHSSIQLLVSSVNLGVSVAARTMIALSIQLQNAEEIKKNLSVLLSSVTEMMVTLSLFIAPAVLGITVALQKVVILTLFSIAVSQGSGIDAQSFDLTAVSGGESFSSINPAGITSMMSIQNVSSVATPTEFIFILAIYIILLVSIMTFFTTRIAEDNELLVKLNLAKSLPIATVVFVISVIAADLFISGFGG
ncbi:MAG: hypothetical protein JW703_00550 [Candidatus Diapherotrites archaeon]|nr:hypothetical protein [Candidatus Diapherotrites archaeon]